MENICGVTEYLRAMILRNGGDPARETLHVCPTREGKAYYRASDGGCWRVYDFVEDTVCPAIGQKRRRFLRECEGPSETSSAGWPGIR